MALSVRSYPLDADQRSRACLHPLDVMNAINARGPLFGPWWILSRAPCSYSERSVSTTSILRDRGRLPCSGSLQFEGIFGNKGLVIRVVTIVPPPTMVRDRV